MDETTSYKRASRQAAQGKGGGGEESVYLAPVKNAEPRRRAEDFVLRLMGLAEEDVTEETGSWRRCN